MASKEITEDTLVIIKPDGVKRKLVGNILSRYEAAGMKVSGIKMMLATEGILKIHYSDDDEDYLYSIGRKSAKVGVEVGDYVEFGRMIINRMRAYMMTGPIVPIVLEGENAVQRVRSITGNTNPGEAEKGTVRGDFGDDDITTAFRENRCLRNLVHASGTKEEAKTEIALWFDESEIYRIEF
jgi:nucleoside-diphosphate kinase